MASGVFIPAGCDSKTPIYGVDTICQTVCRQPNIAVRDILAWFAHNPNQREPSIRIRGLGIIVEPSLRLLELVVVDPTGAAIWVQGVWSLVGSLSWQQEG